MRVLKATKTLGLGVTLGALLWAAPGQGQMFIYPERGQSPEQQQRDRGECHVWAVQQSGFDPAAPRFTELEILDERHACVSEAEIAADAADAADGPDKTIALLDESTEQLIGRISEAEFAVLRDTLEMEGPDDNDYWINDEEIASIATRTGATAHLIGLLRRAVNERTDGVDIRFERDAPRA